jgi:hypothetical protein
MDLREKKEIRDYEKISNTFSKNSKVVFSERKNTLTIK